MSDIVGLKRGTVALAQHHQELEKAFEKEKQNLQQLIGGTALDVQHIGSTSIPNLSAKPIIDMLMTVRSLKDIATIRSKLESAGYEYRENGSDDVQVLFAKGPHENRTHYLHITELGSIEWQNSIGFRDYTRTHPEEAQKYDELKQKLAAQYPNDRSAYTKSKKEFIESIIEKARKTIAITWINPRAEIKESPMGGKGLFATAEIKQDEPVVRWSGYKNTQESEKARKEGKLVMQWDDNLFSIEERGDDPSYFINHSCDPNVWMQDAYTLVARRDISSGEEITADYAFWESDEDWVASWDCHCDSLLCRHKITGKDWRLNELQKRYAGHFSPLINKRIVNGKGNPN